MTYKHPHVLGQRAVSTQRMPLPINKKTACALFLDIVVGEGVTIFEHLSSKDQATLIWWDPRSEPNFLFEAVDGVGRLRTHGDRSAS